MFPASSAAREGSPRGWTFPFQGRSPMSVKLLPPSLDTEYPLRLMAGTQHTRESLKPTTTLLPTAATVVSLSVFREDVPSSARQFTWTLPLVLGSAGQGVPENIPGEWRLSLPLRTPAAASAAAETRF